MYKYGVEMNSKQIMCGHVKENPFL